MKQASDAYKASMREHLRNRSFIEISFGNVDATASTDGTWESNGAESWSEVSTLDYAYDYKKTVATLELNRWTLDGKSVLLPAEAINDGFVSNILSDENGDSEPVAVMTREFSIPHDFPGLTLTFDTRTEEWPLAVTVVFYDGDRVVDTQNVPVRDAQVIINTQAANVDKITVAFDKMLPYRRPRLEGVLYGVMKVYGNDKVTETKESHDVDPLSRRLPKESFTFTILDYEHEYDPDNPIGVYKFVDAQSPISVRYGYELPSGEVEWLKPDKYLLDGKPTVQNEKATFSATGLIGSLSGTFYKSNLGRKNFYDMAEEVLKDANLTLTEQGTNPWDIDPALKEMFTDAVLPIDTHMNCLQLIAHACRSRLFTDDDNIIHIRPFGVTVVGIYSGVWGDNGHDPDSEWNTVDRGNLAATTYASLELNRWVLGDGKQVIIDDNPSGRGYISSQMSGADGNYTETPIFTKVFDVPHDLPVLAIRFDTVLGEHPTSIKVRYFSEENELDSKTVTVTGPEVFVSSALAIDCTKIEVSALSGLPYRKLRVVKVYYRETDFTLDFDAIKEKSQSISKIDRLKEVTVARYTYSSERQQTSTIFEGTTTETQFHIEFSGLAKDVEINVSGGTLVSSVIYGRAADLVLSSGTKTITITGVTLTESSVVVSYPVALEGEVDREENPLITSDEMQTALATHAMNYLMMRNTYDATYRGNPEMEVGDIIGLQTPYTSEIDALILVDEISFNGSLSGKMKVKGLI